MAKTVNGAFNSFMKDYVNLAKERTEKARNSRDALINRINNLDNFLPLDKAHHLHFGSFARRTKIRPIDDIDLMICIDVDGQEESSYGCSKVYVPSGSDYISMGCCDSTYAYYHSYKYTLNSNKIKNKFKEALSNLHDCQKAELHSNMEAITLKFRSYEWNFDIVPCIYVKANYGRDYYLIPDGHGNWKKTDPRIDRDIVTELNKKHEGRVLDLIRLTKYWTKLTFGDWLPSYLVETMVINYCQNQNMLIEYVDINFRCVLKYLMDNINGAVMDLKGIQGNINNLTYENKRKFIEGTRADYIRAQNAYDAETKEQNHEKAINAWREVFGLQFPKYE